MDLALPLLLACQAPEASEPESPPAAEVEPAAPAEGEPPPRPSVAPEGLLSSLSIVVCTRDRPELLARCLAALSAHGCCLEEGGDRAEGA